FAPGGENTSGGYPLLEPLGTPILVAHLDPPLSPVLVVQPVDCLRPGWLLGRLTTRSGGHAISSPDPDLLEVHDSKRLVEATPPCSLASRWASVDAAESGGQHQSDRLRHG